jgi:hypothetical protein
MNRNGIDRVVWLFCLWMSFDYSGSAATAEAARDTSLHKGDSSRGVNAGNSGESWNRPPIWSPTSVSSASGGVNPTPS